MSIKKYIYKYRLQSSNIPKSIEMSASMSESALAASNNADMRYKLTIWMNHDASISYVNNWFVFVMRPAHDAKIKYLENDFSFFVTQTTHASMELWHNDIMLLSKLVWLIRNGWLSQLTRIHTDITLIAKVLHQNRRTTTHTRTHAQYNKLNWRQVFI